MWGSTFYLTCAKLLHDRIFSLRREASVHKTRLIPPGLIEMPVKALPSLKQTEMQSLKVRHQALHEDITIQQNIIKCWLHYTKYNNAKETVFFEKNYFCICSTFVSHDGWIYTFNIGVKPLIHQSELGTYTKVVPFQEKSSFHFVVLWKLLNGMD